VLGRDTLSSGLVGLSIFYALRITANLSLLVTWTSDVETNIVAVERLKEYGEVEQVYVANLSFEVAHSMSFHHGMNFVNDL
jgi:ABC-type multidrug transport system fused ATPase/permease subunit